MNKLKKVLMGLAVMVLPVLVTSSAMATGVAFQSTSLPRQVRVEGRTETVGEVNLLATNGGTVLSGSSITIVYDANISNAPGTGNVNCAGNNGPDGVAGTVDDAAASCNGLAPLNNISVSASGNQLTISFNSNVAYVVGQGITVAGIRVDISALGAGTSTTNAVLSGTSANPAQNPITFTTAIVPVATVQPQAIKPKFPSTPPALLTCNLIALTSKTLSTQANFSVTFSENFPAALTSLVDEQTFSNTVGIPAGATGPTAGTIIQVVLTGVPAGLTIAPTVSGLTGLLTLTVPGAVKSTGSPITFKYTVGTAGQTTTNTGLAEKGSLDFAIQAAKGDVGLLGGVLATVKADVSLETVDGTAISSSTGPALISFSTNNQGNGTVFTVGDCQCYLLFSWLPNTGDGAYDSGLVVNNTTKDPPVIGTKGQTGDVNLYFYRTDGTSPAASPVKLATALGPGETASGVVSTMLGESFLGYAIAVADFQLCHGFAFINNPSPGTGGAFAQGYLPISVTNPRLGAGLVGVVTESQGH